MSHNLHAPRPGFCTVQTGEVNCLWWELHILRFVSLCLSHESLQFLQGCAVAFGLLSWVKGWMETVAEASIRPLLT